MILIHFRFIHRKSYKQQKYSLPFSLLFQNAIDLIFPKNVRVIRSLQFYYYKKNEWYKLSNDYNYKKPLRA